MLAGLHGHIKRYANTQDILPKAKLAHDQRKGQYFKKLELLSSEALTAGTETKETLLKKLQQTTDPKATCDVLGKNLKEHQISTDVKTKEQEINARLHHLDQQKQEAKTPAKMINIMQKEQEFLADLHKNLQYLERHSSKLIGSINNANIGMKANDLGKLNKFTKFLETKSIASTVMPTLKSIHDPSDAHKDLLTRCYPRLDA